MSSTLRHLYSTCFLLLGVSSLAVLNVRALDYSALIQSAETSARAARYEAFRNFQIKGICGNTRLDLATRYGANTLRTYTPPTREELDNYQRIGLKVIAGIWMPHQGENVGKNGIKWDFDYSQQGDTQLKDFEATVSRLGDHPTILMWCLGNEVPLEPQYLETVDRMSLALHKTHPGQLTSITIVNAPKEKIRLIKRFAPDLDVIGYNSYGQGAVGVASQNLEQEWGRAYYVSEFGAQGPWWGRKTGWGEIYEQSYDAKLDDIRKSFRTIDAARLCLGSSMFLWGCWTQQKPTYFSAFLSPGGTNKDTDEKNLYSTPLVDEFCHYWSGKYPQDRAPILTKISITGQKEPSDLIVHTGEELKLTAAAQNPNTANSQLRYRWWILDKKGNTVVGPVDTDEPNASIPTPKLPGSNYVIMTYVIDSQSRASGFTIPIKIESPSSTAFKPVGASHTPAQL